MQTYLATAGRFAGQTITILGPDPLIAGSMLVQAECGAMWGVAQERLPDPAERHEAMRLFTPAPNQIPGQLNL